jgi:xanthine dehydrogenase YagR molybdenum-binding subunit
MTTPHQPTSATPGRGAPAPAETRGTRESPIGQPLSRVDGPLKVRGKARFAAEVPFKNLTYAALVCSTIAKGSVTSIDAADAKAAPGVLLVLTHENAPKLGPLTPFPEGGALDTWPPLQDAQVRWNGQPIALVLAETQEQATYAATLIRVTYQPEKAEVGFDSAIEKAKSPDNVLGQPTLVEIGDAQEALSSSDVRVDNIYSTPRYNHAAMELHGATVAWEGDSLILHDSTQLIAITQSALATAFGIAPDKVRVLSPFVGGGFGGKGLWSYQLMAILASKMAGRPVRVVLSREQIFRLVGGRTITRQRVALGAHRDGRLKALIHTGTAAMTNHAYCPEQFTFPARLLYSADSFLIWQKIAEMDVVANTYMRAPGESVGTFALESAIDELASALNIDPIELRVRLEPAKKPIDGRPFSNRNLVEAYRRGAEQFGWSRRNPQPRANREGDWLIGHGVATATYPYYRFPTSAKIHLSADGHAVIHSSAHEMGMGTATVQAQVAAELLALPVENIRFEYGDSAFPAGPPAGGSNQSASTIAAVSAARDALFEELLKLADGNSPLAGLKVSDVVPRDGGLASRSDSSRFESYGSILARAGRDEIECDATSPEPAEVEKFCMHSYGAQFCEVRVHARTGETRVSRWLGSFDVGRILNARTAASQFRGGIIMGIGLALTEDALFDERSGRFMNPSMAEYHVPVHLDVPKIDVIWNDIPDAHSPLGVHGIGEIGITGAGAAIANAVYNATGKRVRSLPITLDKLM